MPAVASCRGDIAHFFRAIFVLLYDVQHQSRVAPSQTVMRISRPLHLNSPLLALKRTIA
jgi:hypothetical protein